MKKIRERSFSHKKIAFFIVAICFVWLQISNANDNEHNYFEDRDQDGLTDQEELALGTDPDNQDTDSDGYSDSVEVESGYDPLDPSANDQPETNPSETEALESSDVNLTKEFFENFEELKADEIAAMQTLVNDPVQYEEQAAAGELEDIDLTEEEIEALLEETIEEVDIEDEIVELTDEEVNILEPVEGEDAESILDEEKKQVEAYFVKVGYILFEAAPFAIEEESDINNGITSLVGELTQEVTEGDRSTSVELESTASDVYDQIAELEAPYVLKDVHKGGLALMRYSMGQDTDAVFEGDDPLAVMNLLGKAQGVISQFENLEDTVFGMFTDYGIEDFVVPDEIQL